MTLSIVVLSISSCSQELIDNTQFPVGSNGVPRYLIKITELLYHNQYYKDGLETILFSTPTYDEENKIIFAYCNLTGDKANHLYEYNNDSINVIINRRDGIIKNRKYKLNGNRVISCIENSSNSTDRTLYNYTYNPNNQLIGISYYSSENSEKSYFINIVWNDKNISEVSWGTTSSILEVSTYEYNKVYDYKPVLPLFNLSCIWMGGFVGIDEVLILEGYFGNCISKDLPIREYFNGMLSYEFEYSIDTDGYITAISQVSRNEVIKDYFIKWR